MSEIMRVEKTRNYTVMSNYHLTDRRLSLKAIGLLSKILSLPDGWDYTIAGLTQICCEGKAAVATAIKELEAAGYIERCQLRSDNGSFSGTEYIVRESPITENRSSAEMPESPITDFPSPDNPSPDNPSPDNPSPDNPSPENRPQLNTNIPSTNIPPIVPRRKRRNEPKDAPDWKPERFEAFWKSYPCGASKQAAIRAWDKLKPDDKLLEEMAKGLARQLKSEAWQAGFGIPYASTWLNQQRWTDEKRTPPPNRAASDNEGGLQEWR